MSGKLLLNSWKEIAEFVGRTERTVQRWEKLYGLPVHRPAGRERSAVIALASAQTGPAVPRTQMIAATRSGIRRTAMYIEDVPSERAD